MAVLGGVRWCTLRSRGMGSGEAWCVVVYGVYGLCVQRVQWCAGQTGVACDIVVVVYQNTVVKTPHPLHPFVITP